MAAVIQSYKSYISGTIYPIVHVSTPDNDGPLLNCSGPPLDHVGPLRPFKTSLRPS